MRRSHTEQNKITTVKPQKKENRDREKEKPVHSHMWPGKTSKTKIIMEAEMKYSYSIDEIFLFFLIPLVHF